MHCQFMKSFLQDKIIRKVLINRSYFLLGLTMSIIVLSFPFYVDSATLSTSPQDKSVKVGETFTITVNANSQGSSINAAALDIKYDTSILSVQSIGHPGSIFTIWSEEPTYSNINGTIHFSGGLSSPGWNGASGNIIRITFKAKSVGQTKLTLQGGSVLANDGIGTDVLSGVSGSNINIVESNLAQTPAPQVSKAKTTNTTNTTDIVAKATENTVATPSTSIPVLENLPDQLTEGDTLSFNGTGDSNGQIQVYIQKGKKNIEITQLNTGVDGKFNIVYGTPVLSGYYKIWAKNLSVDGVLSASSDVSYVEVTGKNTLNIFGVDFSYNSLLIAILIVSILLLGLFITFLVLYLKLKKNKKTKKKALIGE